MLIFLIAVVGITGFFLSKDIIVEEIVDKLAESVQTHNKVLWVLPALLNHLFL